MKYFLFNPKNNDIYDYDERLARNPVWVKITEEQAYPERFLKPEVVEKVAEEAKKRGRPRLALETDLPAEAPTTPPELAADAARGFGKPRGTVGGLKLGAR